MKRILCIQLPNWPIQRFLAARPELKGRPLVLGSMAGGIERVFACSHEAGALGVVRGQPIAEAMGLTAAGGRSFSGAWAIFPHDPTADRAALAHWAERCERFSPLVGMDDLAQPDSVILDITATARLFDGEEALAQQAVGEFTRARLRVRAAVADAPTAAWAVAHFHPSFLIHRSPLLRIAPGETCDALRLLPIESLCLSDRIVAVLHELGVDLIGQLLALPRKELLSRFGPELLRRLDGATGARPEPIHAVRTKPRYAVRWEFEHPTHRREAICAALRQVVEQLMQELKKGGRGALRVECRMDGQEAPAGIASEGGVCLSVGLFRPTVDTEHVLGLLYLKMERERLAGPMASMEVAAPETNELVDSQMPLFASDMPGHGELPGRQALERLVEQLSSRLGREAVVSARLIPDAQPEQAWRGKPLVGGRTGGKAKRLASRRRAVGKNGSSHEALPASLFGTGQRRPRPLTLFSRPVAVRALPGMHRATARHRMSAIDRAGEDVSPAGIDFAGEEHRLIASWGPERIETGWWRGRQIARDYYLVETAAGRRLWLFRQLDTGRWFVHGAFD